MNGLIRWSPVVALIALVGGLLAAVMIDQLPGVHEEQATIGLTSESEWPFHDSWIATAAGTLDDATIVPAAQEALGLPTDPDAVRTDEGNSGSPSTLTVTAAASTSAQAADLANAVAEAMLDAMPADAPVALIDRADQEPVGDSTSRAALAGGIVGLLGGAAIVPFLDRSLGRLRHADHPELRDRAVRWIDLSGTSRYLPVSDSDDRLVMPIRALPGPIAVFAADEPDLASQVAKILVTNLHVEVIDGGSIRSEAATAALVNVGSTLIVVRPGSIRRSAFERLLARFEELGSPPPAVVLMPGRQSGLRDS